MSAPGEGERGKNFNSILSLVIKRQVVQNVNRMSENNTSVCQYVNMSICQYVSMSICQKATFQLRYENGSCSKYHIVQNGIRMLERHYVNMPVCQNATF